MNQHNEHYIEVAWNIGMQLVNDALWDDDCCTWAGASLELVNGKFEPVHRTFGADLYGGTSGIMFFLTALFSARPDDLLLETIRGAANHALRHTDGVATHGFYFGKPGVAYSLLQCARTPALAGYTEPAMEILSATTPEAGSTAENDIFNGLAGSIPPLLYAYRQTNDRSLLEKAVLMGDSLCDRSVLTQIGRGWVTIPGKTPLTGLSHGNAGICLSLLQLYVASGEVRFLKVAAEGLSYEQHFFEPHRCNWPDFRDGVPADPTQWQYSLAWCNGAPGIALARQCAARITGDAGIMAQAAAGMHTTYKNVLAQLHSGEHLNYSLCHGIAGNADILLEYADPQFQTLAHSVGELGIRNYVLPKLPWPSGVQGGRPTPGLFMGAAGTGYFYLRLADKDKFPTILLPPFIN